MTTNSAIPTQEFSRKGKDSVSVGQVLTVQGESVEVVAVGKPYFVTQDSIEDGRSIHGASGWYTPFTGREADRDQATEKRAALAAALRASLGEECGDQNEARLGLEWKERVTPEVTIRWYAGASGMMYRLRTTSGGERQWRRTTATIDQVEQARRLGGVGTDD